MRPTTSVRSPRAVLRQAPEAGRWLAGHVERIDLAVVSDRRAGTPYLVARRGRARRPRRPCGSTSGLRRLERLRSCGVVRDLPEDLATVVLVGHNPGLEDLASTLAGTSVPMPTSAAGRARRWSGAWAEAGPASVELRTSGRPPA